MKKSKGTYSKKSLTAEEEELQGITDLIERLSLRADELQHNIAIGQTKTKGVFELEDRVVIIDRNPKKYHYGLEGTVKKVTPCYVWIRVARRAKDIQKCKQLVAHACHYHKGQT